MTNFNVNNIVIYMKVHARIIYINYAKLRIGLSLNKNLIDYEPVSFPNIRIGTIIDNVEIKRIDDAIGTLVEFNDGIQGYVHVCIKLLNFFIFIFLI